MEMGCQGVWKWKKLGSIGLDESKCLFFPKLENNIPLSGES
jgi:hypothetical protein